MKTLEQTIKELDVIYWTTGESPVSDAEYDALKVRYLAQGGFDTIHAPAVATEGKIRHERPMLSMQRCFDIAGVIEWATRMGVEIVAMPKFDGVAVVKYESGIVATRGDGEGGDIISNSAPCFCKAKSGLGEAVVRNSRFRKAKGYANPRSLTSGILQAKNHRYSNLVEVAHYADFEYAVTAVSYESILNAVHAIEKECYDYPMDGIIFKVKDNNLLESLGHTKHHWYGQIALKFEVGKVAVA